MTPRTLLPTERPAPEWLCRELAAPPADRALFVRARQEIEAECERAGVYAFDLPTLDALVLKRVASIRETAKAASRHAPANGAKGGMLTFNEAARQIGMSRQFVADLVTSGQVRGEQFGRHWRIDPAEWQRYLRQNKGVRR